MPGLGATGGSPSTPAPTATTTTQQHVALPDGASAASCVETYSAHTLAERPFAFDGTVTGIVMAELTDPEGNPLGPIADVTFDVHEWYAGGSGRSVTLDMTPPVTADLGSDSEWGPPYAVGTRLLVTGESRWGGGMSDAVAWGCGFSRHFSTDEASEWRRAFPAR